MFDYSQRKPTKEWYKNWDRIFKPEKEGMDEQESKERQSRSGADRQG